MAQLLFFALIWRLLAVCRAATELPIPEMVSTSTAFRPNDEHPPLISPIHGIINPQKAKLEFRFLHEDEIVQLRNLKNEWYPVDYGDYYYDLLKDGEIFCFVAAANTEKNRENIQKSYFEKGLPPYLLVGCVCYSNRQRYQFPPAHITHDIKQLLHQRGVAPADYSWEYIGICHRYNYYISSVGVAERFRGMGLAQQLIHAVFSLERNKQYRKYMDQLVIYKLMKPADPDYLLEEKYYSTAFLSHRDVFALRKFTPLTAPLEHSNAGKTWHYSSISHADLHRDILLPIPPYLTFYLSVLPYNYKAKYLYRMLGFIQTSSSPDYYEFMGRTEPADIFVFLMSLWPRMRHSPPPPPPTPIAKTSVWQELVQYCRNLLGK